MRRATPEKRSERRRSPDGMFGQIEAPDCKKIEQDVVKRCNMAYDIGKKAMRDGLDTFESIYNQKLPSQYTNELK